MLGNRNKIRYFPSLLQIFPFYFALSCPKAFPLPLDSFYGVPESLYFLRESFYSTVLNIYSAVLNIYSKVLNMYSKVLNKDFIRWHENHKGAQKKHLGRNENFSRDSIDGVE